ncbi:MAG: methionine synthase [Elusimicrobia bacterium GWA2_66_18]|nr:MAG: methionine synthase [Elusimicrobia bacterium GWA2_66_18]
MSHGRRVFNDRGREDELRELLHRRILTLDGAMGTMLQRRNLTATDFGGPDLEGCNENLVLTRPDVIRSVHEAYFAAGADLVETDTFGSIRHVLAEYGLQDKAREINRKACALARQAAVRHATKIRPRFVAGALGPGTKTISVTGGITYDEVLANYAEAAEGLLEGGADLLLLETQQDTLNVKAALNGIREAFQKAGRSIPVMLSVSIENMGTMLGGQDIAALAAAVEHFDLLALGMNCATGPDFMTDHLRTLSALTRAFMVCYPNAGLPDENGDYNESPEMVARKIARFADEGWVNVVGGCCGTTAEHIRLISEAVAGKAPRRPHKPRRGAVSGMEPLSLDEDRRPLLVGERTNVIGSRKFKDLIVAGELEAAAEIARRQVRAGAHIIDVCLANPDRDEKADMIAFFEKASRKVKVPFMIDSTDAAVMEEALKRAPGKCILNSVNLEDGEKRFEAVVPLLHKYGACLVVGAIDEDKTMGMALTRRRKLAVARRSFDLLTGKYGVAPEDIIFDLLVFPAGTGDKNYWGSALETIEAVRALKTVLPRCKTVLGISNVSFGLPPAGREALNSVFLHHCVEAGLDLAIVNAEKLARYSQIPEEEKKLAWDLLSWKGPGDPAHPRDFDAVAAFSAHFRAVKIVEKDPSERLKLPIDERVAKNVVEGSMEGLLADLDELLKTRKPLDIVNGPLMKGMDEVGRLFGDNRMIVAEVLQSAEVMKASVSRLEPHMTAGDQGAKAVILLATVKGDVHDIGKNLVHIILKNNGYQIVDLGIKVAPERLLEAVREHQPDAIGLSGLLVKSAQMMVVTAEDLTAAGVRLPMLVGGAALSPRFTAKRISTAYDGPAFYAKDAMTGLALCNDYFSEKRDILLAKTRETQEFLRAETASAAPAGAAVKEAPRLRVEHETAPPTPPDLKLHALCDFAIDEIFGYINPIMLYGKHLGLRGGLEENLRQKNPKAIELHRRVLALQDEILEKKLITAKAVYKFFAADAEGDRMNLYESPKSAQALARFDFPRQSVGERLCLSDFVRPAGAGRDFAAMFVVTCGSGIRELSDRYRDAGEYLKSHALQSIAIEAAEGFAELLHERLRRMWGIGDPAGMTVRERFQGKYRGLRVSFGYPACPNLEDQTKLFALLEPEKHAGVRLTEGFMMEPEASVSALVFHHPQARYFSVGQASVAAAK